jgi:C_GCAxxG_C_C family probable redox protein
MITEDHISISSILSQGHWKKKGDSLMERIRKTLELARNHGLNCSQAILSAFGEPSGIDPVTARTLGRPWGGGIGHLAETCGYLSGAVLVLARAYNDRDEAKARKEVFKAVRELFKRFEDRRGTTLCRNLLGEDWRTEEGAKRIVQEKLVMRICHGEGGVGQDAAEILLDLLN